MVTGIVINFIFLTRMLLMIDIIWIYTLITGKTYGNDKKASAYEYSKKGYTKGAEKLIN